GIGGMLHKDRTVQVVMVHGMCTHNKPKIHQAINEIVQALDANVKTIEVTDSQVRSTPPPPALESVEHEQEVLGAKVHFTGIIWSGLTAPLKQQLDVDKTGTPTDCASVDAASCKPVRARINGKAKDGLINDCLSDVLAYQGQSRGPIQRAMVAKLTELATRQPDDDRPLAIVSASLGSKIVFDALTAMLGSGEGSSEKAAGRALSRRLAVVYMEANQLPMLRLAEQNLDDLHAVPGAPAQSAAVLDPLQRFLRARGKQDAKGVLDKLVVVAFTDPNDLLSYRLMNSRYENATDQALVGFADVLVSNDKTYFKWLENPYTAHTTYGTNRDVARFIACGNPTSARCR
ncbi:MAG: hypothetical protein ABI409_18245, partial [Ramlibacter sp.]